MRDAIGNIVGIRLRSTSGKSSVKGTDGNGLFFSPEMLSSDYLIVTEGASDTAAVVSTGYDSTIGMPSCRGGAAYLTQLVSNLRPSKIILIPDHDAVGISGFEELASELIFSGSAPVASVDAILPPDGIDDVREWRIFNQQQLWQVIWSRLSRIAKRKRSN